MKGILSQLSGLINLARPIKNPDFRMNYTKHSHVQLAGFDCCWLGHGQLGAELTVVKDAVLSMQNLGVKINAPPSQVKNSQCLLISVGGNKLDF